LLIDTNYGIYESGVTVYSSFEIRFRLNSTILLLLDQLRQLILNFKPIYQNRLVLPIKLIWFRYKQCEF
jgi:hypothetical protein